MSEETILNQEEEVVEGMESAEEEQLQEESQEEETVEVSDESLEEAAKSKKNEGNEIGRATSELQSHSDLVCRLLLEKKKTKKTKKKHKKTRLI